MRGMTSPEPHKADSTAGLAALTPKLQALVKLLDVKSVLVMRSEFDSMVVKHFEEQQMWRGLPHRLPGLHTSANRTGSDRMFIDNAFVDGKQRCRKAYVPVALDHKRLHGDRLLATRSPLLN